MVSRWKWNGVQIVAGREDTACLVVITCVCLCTAVTSRSALISSTWHFPWFPYWFKPSKGKLQFSCFITCLLIHYDQFSTAMKATLAGGIVPRLTSLNNPWSIHFDDMTESCFIVCLNNEQLTWARWKWKVNSNDYSLLVVHRQQLVQLVLQ